jgi:hypothetical protein
MISRICGFVLVFSMLPVSSPVLRGQVSAEQRKLAEIERALGPQVKGHSNVFAATDDYVAKVQFDKGDAAKEIFVFNKSYLNRCDPNWEVPAKRSGLSPDGYREVLSKIGVVQELGILTEKVDVGLVTNQQSNVIEQYQKAFVDRRVFKISAVQEDYFTYSFHVYSIHQIKGILDTKQNTAQFGLEKIFKVKIDGDWYYTTKGEFDKGILGNQVSLNVAGPINNRFEDCP